MKRNTSLPWLAAVALGVAALTATPAAADTANDYPEDALKFASVTAYRYAGDQPVDLVAQVVDVEGSVVEGAAVTVEINTARSAQPLVVHLEDKGGGFYLACDAAFLDGATDEDIYEFTATKDRMHPAFARVKSDRGNFCGEGAPQIEIASFRAAKLAGNDQPLSVIVDLVDDGGNPVTGANVAILLSNDQAQADALLAETDGGRYASCNIRLLNTTGTAQISLTVHASAKGYRPATASTETTTGYLCANPVPALDTARRTR